MSSRIGVLLACLGVAVCVGCGPSRPALAPVSGRVTLDGQPLEGATVMFQPESGRPSFGTTDQIGKYTMRYTVERMGVLPGKSKVGITSVVENDQGQTVRREILPKKYHSQSELQADVETQANVFDFELFSK